VRCLRVSIVQLSTPLIGAGRCTSAQGLIGSPAFPAGGASGLISACLSAAGLPLPARFGFT
jgi:hypothetical protein